MTPDDHVVFARQYKHGFGEFVLELPAGAIEPGEEPLACAKRELEEETGYVASEFEPLAEFIADPTSSTGKLFLFVARGAVPHGVRSLDPTEDIATVLVPLHRVLDEVRSGHVCSQSQVAAIYSVLDSLDLLG